MKNKFFKMGLTIILCGAVAVTSVQPVSAVDTVSVSDNDMDICAEVEVTESLDCVASAYSADETYQMLHEEFKVYQKSTDEFYDKWFDSRYPEILKMYEAVGTNGNTYRGFIGSWDFLTSSRWDNDESYAALYEAFKLYQFGTAENYDKRFAEKYPEVIAEVYIWMKHGAKVAANKWERAHGPIEELSDGIDKNNDVYQKLYTLFKPYQIDTDEVFEACFDEKYLALREEYLRLVEKKESEGGTVNGEGWAQRYRKDNGPIEGYPKEKICVCFDQDFARNEMFNVIQAWRQNPDNWIVYKRRIKYEPLMLDYDYNLEQYAMKRAAECAVKFKHIELTGQAISSEIKTTVYGYSEDMCEEVIPEAGKKQQVAEKIMWAFAEDEEWSLTADWFYQEHRLDFLQGSYDRVGIGVCHNGYESVTVVVFGSSDGSLLQRANRLKSGSNIFDPSIGGWE